MTIRIGGKSQSLHLAAQQSQQVTFTLPPGLPYEKEVHALVWAASVAATGGFTPIFHDPAATDTRYLGIRVKPMLLE